ncbi:MAG: cytochrome c biogenesis CcdA family protein, partial [Ktedonobacterales bacterium]
GSAMQAGVGAGAAVFLAGLLSFFSPCVAPLVPGYIGYLSGAALRGEPGQRDERMDAGAAVAVRARLNPAVPVCLLFVAGFSAAFVALGLVSASFGHLLVAYQPVLETLAGIVMLIMGAFLLNLLPRRALGVLLREARLRIQPGALGRLGVVAPFALGVVFAAGWTPCIGPVLASILAYVGANGSTGLAIWLLSLYALGFAVPFLAVGLGWAEAVRLLGWVQRHGHALSLVSGVALVLVAAVYLTGQVSVFAIWAQHISALGPR